MDQSPRAGVHPIVWILVALAVIPCLLCGACVIGSFSSRVGVPPAPTEIPPDDRSKELHLHVTSAALKTNRKGARVIGGTLMNTSGKKYSHVTVTYWVYDKNQNRLGEAKAFLTNVPSGKPVTFEADIGAPLVYAIAFQAIDAQ